MNDKEKNLIDQYHQKKMELQQLLGAYALSGLSDIEQLSDISNHPSKTTKDESHDQ